LEIVRQAHLPGNYELYDEDSNALGAAVCKHCWESQHIANSSSLATVWLSVDGLSVALWLCKSHRDVIGSGPSMLVIKSEGRVMRNPEIAA
jgi:hypothetical protein